MSALMTWLQRTLPKPLLFGLYGAIGALLGAVILGEVLWAALQPPPPKPKLPPPPPPPALRLTASAALGINQGDKNKFLVRIVRDYFEGPVVLKCADLPKGITAKSVTLKPDQSEAHVELSAEIDAKAGEWPFQLSAEAPDQPAKLAAEVPVRLTVVKIERLTASEALGVNQGDKNQFTVRIVRDNFTGPVVLRCVKLPDGVEAPEVTLDGDQTEAEMEVTADAAAADGKHTFHVTAEAREQPGKVFSSGPIQLTVVKVDVPPPPTVDIVFLLDITGSMQFAIDGVTKGIGDFADELAAKQLDARVGLIAFRDNSISEESELLKFEGEPFTNKYDLFRRSMGGLSANGGGDGPESSLDALEEAAQLPFRRESTRVLLLITDAPPREPDEHVRSVKDAVKILKQNGIDQLHLVVPGDVRRTYAPLQKSAPGDFFDLQEAANGSAGFASILPKVSAKIADIVRQNRPEAPPAPVTKKAAPPSEPPPVGKKAALPPPPLSATPAIKAVQSGQEFDADSSGRLLLAIAVWTSVPALGICLALMFGQSFYLKQSGLSSAQLGQGTLGGVAAGLIGGLAGQLLFQTSGSLAQFDALFRILGWSLLGSLVGLGMSFFVPNLRRDKGFLGGAAGGAVGAIGFVGASWILNGIPGGDLLGRVIGAVILGFFIGLMVAWFERAFRHLWLEVGYGGREVRQVTLGAEPVSIGSNAPRCTIYVRSAPDVAFRYWVQQGKVMCEDVVTRISREMSVGEKQTVGGAEVIIKSSNAAAKPAPAKTKIIPPVIPPPPPSSRAGVQQHGVQQAGGQPPRPATPTLQPPAQPSPSQTPAPPVPAAPPSATSPPVRDIQVPPPPAPRRVPPPPPPPPKKGNR